MNRRQTNQAQSFIRADEFTDTLLPDFTHQPPTPVDLKFASARTRLDTAIKSLGGRQAIQAGGEFSEETEKQRRLRTDLREELSDVNGTADAIAAETTNRSLMERFRIPDSHGDVPLVATARAFATAIRELSLNDEFAAHGHPSDTATDLDNLATALEGSEGKQGIALGEPVHRAPPLHDDMKFSVRFPNVRCQHSRNDNDRDWDSIQGAHLMISLFLRLISKHRFQSEDSFDSSYLL